MEIPLSLPPTCGMWALQTQILQLMGMDESIYTRLERCNLTKPVPL